MSSTAQPLSGKVAIITGGTKGIGRSTAIGLTKLGANVVVSYGSDTGSADSLVKEVGSEKILAVQADGSSISGIQTLIDATVSKFSKIDILIPNAGRLAMQNLENLTEAEFDKSYALNVKGPLFLAQAAVPHMSAGGRIVFISTTQNFASTVTAPYMLYCSTKGAIDQITRTLAKDLASKGINVNAIAPGPTGTDLFFEGKSEQMLKMIASLNPFNRIGKPDEVADAIVFLCGEGSRWVNGQILKVNGGQFVG